MAECKVICTDSGEEFRFAKDAELLERVKEEVEDGLKHTLSYYKDKIPSASHYAQLKTDRTLSGYVDFRPTEGAISPSSISFDCTPDTCAIEGEFVLKGKKTERKKEDLIIPGFPHQCELTNIHLHEGEGAWIKEAETHVHFACVAWPTEVKEIVTRMITLMGEGKVKFKE